MKYFYISTFTWLFGIFSVFSQSYLATYLTTAAENNPKLKAGFQSYLAALERIPQVKALPDPQLAFGYFIQPVETKTGPQQFKLTLTQMFPWFGSLQLSEQTQTYRAKAAYEDFLQNKALLFKQVKFAYYELFFLRKKIEILKENITIIQRFKSLSQQKLMTGKASYVDVLRADMALNQIKNDLKFWQDRIRATSIKFQNLINKRKIEIMLPEQLSQTILPPMAVLEKKLINNHLVLKHDLISQQFEAKAKLAYKKSLPKFSLGLDYTNVGSDINDSFKNDALFFKIGMSLPVFRSKYKAAVNEAKYLQDVSSQKKEAVRNNVSTQLADFYSIYENNLRKINLYQKQIKLARRSIRLLESDYSSGLPVFEEVLRMEQKYLQYQILEQKSFTELHKTVAAIQFLIGSLKP